MFKKVCKLRRYLSIKDFFRFLRALINNRRTIVQMVKMDFKNQYLGSFLGLFWAFFQPAVYIFVLWFIFAVGFRKGRSGEIPFFLYLMSGICIWSFFSESFNNGANSVLENSYLVKEIVFQVSMLPVVKILSCLMVHFIFIGLLLVMYLAHGFSFDIYGFQILYYLFATIILLLGLSWITSAVHVFVKDINQIIKVIIRLGFWFSPIFWDINMFPPKIQFILKLNPAYYLINGYRDSLFYKVWFWEQYELTIYFWIFTLFILGFGAIVFKRLRPHFADVM